MVEKMQKVLNETDYLDLLQSSFRPGLSTETAPALGGTWLEIVHSASSLNSF